MQFFLLLTFILAPAYVIRFGFFHLPTNLLMLWVFLLWVIFGLWLFANKKVREFIRFKLSLDKKILIPVCLFLLAGFISLFIGGIDRAKLGQFIVLFFQPISLFFIAGYIFKRNPKSKNLILYTLYIILAAAGLYAALQYFTLLSLPPLWWGNSVEPKRALSFFVHPNFYALWCAPLLALLIPDVFASLKTKTYNLKPVLWLLGAIGLLLSLSRSGWLGLAVAVLVYLIIAADNKIRKVILGGIIVIVMVIVYYPNLRYRVLLPFYGEKSANSRIELWSDGLKAIKESPVLGLGLTGFAKQYGQLNTDPTLDTHNFPHNIFLNLWVETGLLGLISLIGLIGLIIYRGLKNRADVFALGISLFLIAIIFQGLVDNPYFKNDLALVFWIILALVI
jgi:O-antigen ligase